MSEFFRDSARYIADKARLAGRSEDEISLLRSHTLAQENTWKKIFEEADLPIPSAKDFQDTFSSEMEMQVQEEKPFEVVDFSAILNGDLKSRSHEKQPLEEIPHVSYSPSARRAILEAKRVAERFHHPYLSNEHLLIGLVKQRDGVARLAFNTLGADPSRVIAWSEIALRNNPIDRYQTDGGITVLLKETFRIARSTEVLKSRPQFLSTHQLLIGIAQLNVNEPAQRILDMFCYSPKILSNGIDRAVRKVYDSTS